MLGAFSGQEYLNIMSASWFVSYLYHNRIDETEVHWASVKTIDFRRKAFNNSIQYHRIYLDAILKMSENKLSTNTIGLTGAQIKNMVVTLLKN